MGRSIRVVAAVVGAVVLAGLVLSPAWGATRDPLSVKILALNDLHGGIDTGRTVGGRAVGGAGYLAAAMKQRAAGHQHVLVVGAGDMVGASPPVSALLRDEPTVQVMNALGFLVNAPGNHEFDRGVTELQRLTQGGCHPETGCFEGARFAEISANVIVRATGLPLLRPYLVQRIEGEPIAFIGATHSDVANLVIRGAVDGLEFSDPAPAVNRYVGELKAQGVHSFVVLIHEGGQVDSAGVLSGPIARTVGLLDPEVDLVISAHSHQGYAVGLGGKLVTQAYSYGTAFADIDLTIDRGSGDVTAAQAEIVTVYDDLVGPDPTVQAIIDQAQAQVAPRIERIVGEAARDISAEPNRAGESALGNLIADAQRWKAGTPIACTNSGGIRAGLRAGPVSWGALFAVQPFSNDLVVLTLSGEQLYGLLNQQWTVQADGAERFRPLPCAGLWVTWDGGRPLGDRIVALALDDGSPIDRAARYRLAVNSFLAGGGSGSGILTAATDPRVVAADLDAFVDYVAQLPQPFEAPVEGRISRLD
jgi:5'-nucleotidase